MPIYEYECRSCGQRQDCYLTRSEHDKVATLPCVCGDACVSVMGLPAPHKMGGREGTQRTHALIKKRSEAFHTSKRGIEQGTEARRAAHARAASKMLPS